MNDIKPITVEDIQNSLRLDSNIDVSLIQRYINTAENYVKNAVDSTVDLSVYRNIDEFNSAVALLTEFYYQTRGEATDSPSKRPFEVTAMIIQLKGMDLNK